MDLPERGERRDALDQRMAAFLDAAGVSALPVPNALADRGRLDAWLEAVKPGGLVLTGGENAGVHPERDRTEAVLLAYAEAQGLPVLGVCRGLQVMAARAGAALVAVEGHRRTRHRLEGDIGGEVNSFHDFAPAACPDGFEVAARGPGGSIEALRARSRPWEGWMWHPECEAVFASRDVDAARRLFAGAAR